ncbi:hypothetical protein LINPERPRIM_LOCUS26309 [Linum perenne]
MNISGIRPIKSLALMFMFAATVVKRSDQTLEWPRKDTMHIINELTSLDLIVHCRSKDDDLGAKVVHVKSEFNWSFTGYGTTLFRCNVAVQDKRTHFVAFDGRGYCPFHWVVDDNGVHANETGCQPTYYPWPNF